jgi:hypothetical protein
LITERNGFRKGISPENAVFRLADSVLPLNQNMHVGGLDCDLPKVLIVWIMKFLVRLYFYGTGGVSEDWFRSCLSNRRQKVDIKVTKYN